MARIVAAMTIFMVAAAALPRMELTSCPRMLRPRSPRNSARSQLK
jgi:hypothetical protein